MDQEKVKAIMDWPIPKKVNEVRNLHDLASFYRRFVKSFSTIVSPVHEVVKKNVDFKRVKEQETSFRELKNKLSNAPILFA